MIDTKIYHQKKKNEVHDFVRYVLPTVFSKGSAAICYEPMRQGGPCLAHISMFYYDSELKTCQPFIYSGCNGNNNRFNSKEECEKECGKDVCTMPSAKGLCHEEIWRWYYDYETRECKLFKYSGCHGNENNFETKKECDSKCPA
ncbi:UNVERIFIED_CONTAM: BPTI/Kunitz domain-containing protein [Trichonephila clavipes]